MSRMRLLIISLFALALSGVATYLVYENLKSRLQPEGEGAQIVVAAVKLGLGDRIEETALRLAPWSSAVPIEGAFYSFTEVVGRGVVIPMLANEPVLESKLAPRGAGAGLTSAIPEGMRAVSVKVNEIVGVAGFVLPGTRVDVILTGSPEKGREIEMSRIILENVQVLAAGQNLEQEVEGKAQKVQVITLLVTPAQAQALALAQNDGLIQLALRNPLDLEQSNPEGVYKDTLYTGVRPPKEAPPPPPRPVRVAKPAPAPPPPVVQAPIPVRYEVELIQGGSRETLSFEAGQAGSQPAPQVSDRPPVPPR